MRVRRRPALLLLAGLFVAAAILRALFPWTQPTVAITGFFLLALSFTILWRLRRRLAFGDLLLLLTTTTLLCLAFLSTMTPLARIGITLLVVVIATFSRFQSKHPVLQYVFLCRFPLLVGGALLLLPISYFLTPSMFRNLFHLGPAGLGLATFLALLLSWVVMVTFNLIGGLAHLRFRVPRMQLPTWLEPDSAEGRLWGFALLTAPLLTLLVWEGEGPLWARLLGVGIGLVMARLVFEAGALFSDLLAPREAPEWDLVSTFHEDLRKKARGWNSQQTSKLRSSFETWLHRKPSEFHAGYVDEDGRLFPGHATALGFLTITFLFYSVGFLAAFPAWTHPVEVPALAYVLVLLILVGWFLPLTSFFLDRFRVPTVLVLVAASSLFFFINDIEHYYELLQRNDTPQLGVPRVTTVEPVEDTQLHQAYTQRVSHWERRHGENGREPVLVLVTANGGGITAALWTAQVLSSLAESFGSELTDSIHLVSSVSGGSVGTMYFLSALSNGAEASPPDFDRVRQAAASSSLGATAWGFAYPDFWRALSLKLPFMEHLDRGWALEQAWTRHFRDHDLLGASKKTPTFSEWERRALAGELPVAVFNATRTETGENLPLSSLPLPFGAQPPWRKDKDLSVVTAARLSATFPFVSPIARPLGENAYHLADGGYYDNYGTTTAARWIDWLYRPQTLEAELKPRKILLIEIRASGTSEPEEPKQRGGWAYATVGPILTLLKVRGTSQLQRNEFELDLLERLGEHLGYELERVPFILDRKSPLSWHLTDAERDDILSYRCDGALEEVREFLCSAEGWCSPDSAAPPHSPRKTSCGSVDAARWAGSHAAVTEIASSSPEAAARVTGSAVSTP